MKLSDFKFELPEKLIAQKPAKLRDHCKLMVVDVNKKNIEHKKFFEVESLLQKGDVLVLNNSKVIPARLKGIKETGGRVEILLVRKDKENSWLAMLKNFKQSELGKELFIGDDTIKNGKKTDKIVVKPITYSEKDNIWLVQFNCSGNKLDSIITKYGSAPTPPYIKRLSDLKEYQTVFAKTAGSVAAPTAGFHFTKALLNRLIKKGVQIEYVTLHVGPGTFSPIRIDDFTKHKMHAEFASIDQQTATRINKAKKDERRIIAVGTTSSRTLEGFTNKNGLLEYGQRELDIFIYPGYKFKMVDALITNFHLPESTLLLLVTAFATDKFSGVLHRLQRLGGVIAGKKYAPTIGRDIILSAYSEAIKKKYKFYSFGDAMFIK